MAEVYRAFRLYSNCFQPSMKRIVKEEQADPVRRRYDPAKTPLQRLLLSGVLSPAKEQELTTIVQALDPVRLLHQLRELQAALFRCAVNASPFAQHQLVMPIQVFVWERCLDLSLPSSLLPSPASLSHTLPELLGEHLLSWKWYRTNLFVGEWDYIASCLRECPDLTAPALFQRLQSRAPGRYHPGQLRFLSGSGSGGTKKTEPRGESLRDGDRPPIDYLCSGGSFCAPQPACVRHKQTHQPQHAA